VGHSLTDQLPNARIYDLEQPRFRGMPMHPAHQPGYFYALYRRHRDNYRPAELDQLARDRCHEFAFIGIPLKFCGATGSLYDPWRWADRAGRLVPAPKAAAALVSARFPLAQAMWR
jgi:hypothetical protein